MSLAMVSNRMNLLPVLTVVTILLLYKPRAILDAGGYQFVSRGYAMLYNDSTERSDLLYDLSHGTNVYRIVDNDYQLRSWARSSCQERNRGLKCIAKKLIRYQNPPAEYS